MAQARDEAGNIWEVDAQGNPVRLVRAAGAQAVPGGIVVKPADPTRAYEAPKAAADLAIAQGKVAMTPAEIRKAEADARAADASARKAEAEAATGNLEAQKNADAKRGRAENLKALQSQIDRVRSLYTQNLRGGAPNGLNRFIPNLIRPDLGQFDTAGAGLAEQALGAFRVPGVGSQSDAELRAFVEANRPLQTDSDLEIEEKLANIQRRLDAANAGLGIGAPVKDDRRPAVAAIGGIPNVSPPAGPDQIDPTGGNPLLSPQDRAFLSQNARTLGPEGVRQYVAARGLRIPEDEIQAAFDYYSKGGSQNPVVNVPQGEGSVVGRIAASPVGSFAISAGDLASGGLLDEAAGALGGESSAVREAIDLSREQNPTSSLLGSLAGGAIGALGAGKIAGAIPGIGARAAAIGGGIVPDLIYGGVYGAGSADDGDRLTGALTGAGLAGAGNVIGGAIVGGAGRAVRGVSAPAVRRLNEAGVPMTAGQIMGGSGVMGRTIKSLEDASESVPLLGSLIRSRRDEGIQGFNRAALKEALEPINAQVQGTIGNDAIEQAQGLVGDAYTRALGGVNLAPDDAYGAAINQATAAGQKLPGGLSSVFEAILANRVAPQITETGMSGRGLQAALQGLRKDSGDVIRRGEIQGDLLKGATVDVEDALMDLAERQAPGTVEGLGSANSAFRNLSIIEDAALKADNAGGVFTPAQLGMATKQNAKRFGGKHAAARGDVPMRELQQAGQEILPSTMGNSGTADRVLATAVLPSLLGGAAATGAASDYLSPEAAGGIGIMSALATRQGRNALQKLLVSRPEAARSIGDQIYNNRAIGSMIGVPLLLGVGSQ